MNLVSVYRVKGAAKILYDLLAERPVENRISHEVMPTPEEHNAFMFTKPFQWWYLIEDGGEYVGAIEVTDFNEIGVTIFQKHVRKGYGTKALDWFMEHHKPLPAIPARRCGYWTAHVAPQNEASKAFFRKAGFVLVQETYAKR